jgi:hypothetical protein
MIVDPCILDTLYVLHMYSAYVRKLHTSVICNEYIFRCHPIGILVDTGTSIARLVKIIIHPDTSVTCYLWITTIDRRNRLTFFSILNVPKMTGSGVNKDTKVACNTGVRMNNNLYKSAIDVSTGMISHSFVHGLFAVLTFVNCVPESHLLLYKLLQRLWHQRRTRLQQRMP